MNKTILATCIAATLVLTGCGALKGVTNPITGQPFSQRVEISRYEWSLKAMDQIPHRDLQKCLAVLGDYKVASGANTNEVLAEISNCAIATNGVATRLTFISSVPDLKSQEFQILLDRSGVGVSFGEAREATGKPVKSANLDSFRDDDWNLHIKSAKWSYGNFEFEAGQKGLVFKRAGKVMLDTGNKVITGNERNLFVKPMKEIPKPA